MASDGANEQFRIVMEDMTKSMSSVRELVKELREKSQNTTDLDFKDGISLLSLKHQLMLAYMQSLILVNSHRSLGHTLEERARPTLPFSSPEREARGDAPGDFVDSMVEGRLVLEKIKILEGRMRYQIEKLVRVAEEAPSADSAINDPLAFRPNPQNLMGGDMSDAEEEGDDNEQDRDRSGIYRPPKLAPMPYTEPSKDRRARRAPIPTTLASLAHLDPSKPFVESTTGVGSAPAHSGRAREIQRMTEFEEDNMTRLVLKKKDERRRRRDEEDIALGGTGELSGRRRGGGFEDEFGDVLRSVGRAKGGVIGDGYEQLREKGRKEGALGRSRVRARDDVPETGDDAPRQRKRSRFEKETKNAKQRVARKRK
ncbi:hypothetical protein FA95DRAFT_1559452 [Auriscalpium vulgare]|uniref:Uncharacterized protein n=1 Tax=Auriscalpium vulgare TaxID=40419 RepID=A0ACB8RT63_9AGAM|nr:hypothetical protein FA95DRAFT_1559452 [Auriscalpium vulgare]